MEDLVRGKMELYYLLELKPLQFQTRSTRVLAYNYGYLVMVVSDSNFYFFVARKCFSILPITRLFCTFAAPIKMSYAFYR